MEWTRKSSSVAVFFVVDILGVEFSKNSGTGWLKIRFLFVKHVRLLAHSLDKWLIFVIYTIYSISVGLVMEWTRKSSKFAVFDIFRFTKCNRLCHCVEFLKILAPIG